MRVGKLYKIRNWNLHGPTPSISLYDAHGNVPAAGAVKLHVGDVVIYLGTNIHGRNPGFNDPLLFVLTSSGAVGAYSLDSNLGRKEENYFEEVKRTS